VIFSRKAILLGGAHQTSGEPDLKLICPVSRHGCRMPRNNRHRKKLRFFCEDDAGTGTSSLIEARPAQSQQRWRSTHYISTHYAFSPPSKAGGENAQQIDIQKIIEHRKNRAIE